MGTRQNEIFILFEISCIFLWLISVDAQKTRSCITERNMTHVLLEHSKLETLGEQTFRTNIVYASIPGEVSLFIEKFSIDQYFLPHLGLFALRLLKYDLMSSPELRGSNRKATSSQLPAFRGNSHYSSFCRALICNRIPDQRYVARCSEICLNGIRSDEK